MLEIVQEGKTREDALQAALEKLDATEDQVEVEVVDEGAGGIFGLIGSRPIKIKVILRDKNKILKEFARDFVDNVFNSLSINAKFHVEDMENEILVSISGDESGILIGKFGQTLDSLQYLANVVAARKIGGDDSIKKIVIDVENYRQRREESLVQMAQNVASKVVRTRSCISLAPMHPHDRRIIHMALAGNSKIHTHSEGVGSNRKVVVSFQERK